MNSIALFPSQSSGSECKLDENEIHLWFYPHLIKNLRTPSTEHRSATKKKNQVAAENLLRHLLARYLGQPPASLSLARTRFGKPYLTNATDLQFNISHSGTALLVAIARGISLGVDLEQLDQTDRLVLPLAKRFFCTGEYLALAALPVERQQFSFMDLWTCKEAIVKALGQGLSFGLNQLEFELIDGAPSQLINIATAAGTAKNWQCVRLSAPGYIGAVAWHGDPRRINIQQAETDF